MWFRHRRHDLLVSSVNSGYCLSRVGIVMHVPYDFFGALGKVVLLLAAFMGPKTNADDEVPMKEKVDALKCLADTGNVRDCESVLADIRKKKKKGEESLQRYLEDQQAYEDGVKRELKALDDPKTQPVTKLVSQKVLTIYYHNIRTTNMLGDLQRTQIEGRQQEENAFMLFYEAIKARRGNR
jgi:hypothetical protein